MRAVPDVLTSSIHVFLLPGMGAAGLVALHERLYSSSLRAYKRRGIEYLPHLTVATHSSVQSAEAVAQTLQLDSAERRAVRGVVSAIQLVHLGAHAVETIATFDLQDDL